MRNILLLLFFVTLSYSQKNSTCGATISYAPKTKSILLNTPIALFTTEDSDYEVRVRIRRYVPMGIINGTEYGYVMEQPCFEYTGYKLPMFWAFSTEASVKYKSNKGERIDTRFEIFNAKPGTYHLIVDKLCYKEVIESSDVSIIIK
jgi:hypothetical protein